MLLQERPTSTASATANLACQCISASVQACSGAAGPQRAISVTSMSCKADKANPSNALIETVTCQRFVIECRE